MIIGDKNRKLLVAEKDVTIVRSCSIIKYDAEYNSQTHSTVLELPRAFKNKIYDYTNSKLISIQTNEQKSVSLGKVVDYFKVEKDFFFVKEDRASKSLHSIAGKCLLRFSSAYQFEGSFLYFIKDYRFHKFNLLTLEESEINISPDLKSNAPVAFCCKRENISENETIIFADYLNKIYIHSEEKHRLYHWMSNKIVYLNVYDRYVIAISKKGNVVRFHIDIQKIEPLFNFHGIYVDVSCSDNKLYLLTDFEFIIFDLVVGNTVFKVYLIGSSEYKISRLEAYSDKRSDDVFNMKRHSKVEIMNLIDYENKRNHKEVSPSSGIKEYITYILEKHLFVVDAHLRKVISIFKLDDNSACFVCGSICFSFVQRKSNVILKIFKVFTNRIIQTKTVEFSWKGSLDLANIFTVKDKLYLLVSQNVYIINKMGFLEMVYDHKNCKSLKYFEDYICAIDEKGIFNIATQKYEVVQKKIMNCCIFKSRLLFYIEDKGIYCDKNNEASERCLILQVNNVIDMKAKDTDILETLQYIEGKCIIVEYSFERNESLVKCNEVTVENQSNKILLEKLCASGSNTMLG
ncbi:uncharacterized protein VICG_00731 [Vittaforma corneae ATCC 50505]|uniref:Uncharacterized protein n=1 Tax=Vittaforma corneae (strain ATCC 50505) TaxID=993615 RepID=L2GNB6_VITCO|nr:uncharacterized protein VICG_00731 [Vittaforma corneae ATCC 50505]ELA42331.1 hypothetical protein VICG_00731 [Vittaforma corneae ATCC 50505]